MRTDGTRWGTLAARAIVLLGLVSLGTAVAAHEQKKPATPRRIAISVTEKGFEPNGITVKKGETVVLVFTRKTEHTCAKEVIVYLEGDKQVQQPLPLDTPVEITATFSKAGELGYACKMRMHAGAIAPPGTTWWRS